MHGDEDHHARTSTGYRITWKFSRKELHMTVIHLVLSAAVCLGAQQPPQTLDQIPVHPGAVPDRATEADAEHQPGRTFRAYRVPLAVDEVVKFYKQRLGAREVTQREAEALSDEFGQPKVAVGATSPVLLQVEAHDFAGEMSEVTRQDPAAGGRRLAALFTRRRPPYRPSVWLRWGNFTWMRRDNATGTTSFEVSVSDAGHSDLDAGTLDNTTTIQIVIDQQSETKVDPDAEPADLAPRAALAEPRSSELGVPKYPGSAFDARMSGDMSTDAERYFVYTTADPPERVAAFFERHATKRPEHSVDSWLFSDLDLTIQPNAGMYAPTVKTVITVRKARP